MANGHGGARANSGPKKGSKNVVTQSLKENILKISQDLNKKKKGLAALAEEDPKWFFTNFVKPMIPKEVEASVDASITVNRILFGNKHSE